MFIRTLKISKKIIIFTIILFFLLTSIILFYSFANIDLSNNSTNTNNNDNNLNNSNDSINSSNNSENNNPDEDDNSNENDNPEKKNDFIKWVDFNVTSDLLNKTAKLDIDSHIQDSNIKYNWIELLAYLACKNGGNFKNFKQKDLDTLLSELQKGKTIEDLAKNNKYYSYYYESYSAALGGFIGNYTVETELEDGTKTSEEKYGLKAFLPIAKNYAFSHYDDFGNSRSYGFKRTHLGNDLMGSIGTPIIAVESGTIEHLGWNQYGGWRIGIRSFDKKRYYYYAHLRKNHPYAEGLEEGYTVKAGEVIGYLGMTGYSIKENVNNINVPHLHFGMQLVFDESQIDSANEVWINVYNIIEFLKKNRSEGIKKAGAF